MRSAHNFGWRWLQAQGVTGTSWAPAHHSKRTICSCFGHCACCVKSFHRLMREDCRDILAIRYKIHASLAPDLRASSGHPRVSFCVWLQSGQGRGGALFWERWGCALGTKAGSAFRMRNAAIGRRFSCAVKPTGSRAGFLFPAACEETLPKEGTASSLPSTLAWVPLVSGRRASELRAVRTMSDGRWLEAQGGGTGTSWAPAHHSTRTICSCFKRCACWMKSNHLLLP